ncbi:MAG: argininosuccinate lyase [Trueperaceae bacterium]
MNDQGIKVSRERLEAGPGEIYARTVLLPVFEFKRQHLYLALVRAHKAWVAMLETTGNVTSVDAAKLLATLDDLGREGHTALGEFDPNLEYFYSHMEHQLNLRLGEDVAGNINIARTRPEPLARMLIRERLLTVIGLVIALRKTLIRLAAREASTVMPGWTHFQHAQAATVGHYFLAIQDVLQRDTVRLDHAYATVNRCTLGCGALAGTSYEIDREHVARALGFDGLIENSLDCVAGADHYTETIAALTGMMINLSRFCDDLYTLHTWEFRFLEIGDDYSGSSSMMPQKKNPYPFEYVRARAGHIAGLMSSAHTILHNTNFQDIKDVEEEALYPVFEALTQTERALELLDGTLSTVRFDAERMLQVTTEGFSTATELAAVIHRTSGLSYRTSHRIVGDVVRRAVSRKLAAVEVTEVLVNEAAVKVIGRPLELITAQIKGALDPTAFVNAHVSRGGTAPVEVHRMIEERSSRITTEEKELATRVDGIAERDKV